VHYALNRPYNIYTASFLDFINISSFFKFLISQGALNFLNLPNLKREFFIAFNNYSSKFVLFVPVCFGEVSQDNNNILLKILMTVGFLASFGLIRHLNLPKSTTIPSNIESSIIESDSESSILEDEYIGIVNLENQDIVPTITENIVTNPVLIRESIELKTTFLTTTPNDIKGLSTAELKTNLINSIESFESKSSNVHIMKDHILKDLREND
jgi:hypothetical protein